MSTFTEEQVKAQLTELMTVRLADFVREQTKAFNEGLWKEDVTLDSVLNDALERMGWPDKKIDMASLLLRVQFDVRLWIDEEKEKSFDVQAAICPSVGVLWWDGADGEIDGNVSSQHFRKCNERYRTYLTVKP